MVGIPTARLGAANGQSIFVLSTAQYLIAQSAHGFSGKLKYDTVTWHQKVRSDTWLLGVLAAIRRCNICGKVGCMTEEALPEYGHHHPREEQSWVPMKAIWAPPVLSPVKVRSLARRKDRLIVRLRGHFRGTGYQSLVSLKAILAPCFLNLVAAHCIPRGEAVRLLEKYFHRWTARSRNRIGYLQKSSRLLIF